MVFLLFVDVDVGCWPCPLIVRINVAIRWIEWIHRDTKIVVVLKKFFPELPTSYNPPDSLNLVSCSQPDANKIIFVEKVSDTWWCYDVKNWVHSPRGMTNQHSKSAQVMLILTMKYPSALPVTDDDVGGNCIEGVCVQTEIIYIKTSNGRTYSSYCTNIILI